MWDGKVLFALGVSVVLTAVFGRLIAWRLRRRVLALMSAGTAPMSGDMPRAVADRAPARRKPVSASRADNRAARRRLVIVLIGLSLLMGMTEAGWTLRFAYGDNEAGPIKVALVGLVYTWVMVPVLGQIWRWRWATTAAVSLAYLAVIGCLVWLRSTEAMTVYGLAAWLLPAVAPVLIVIGLAATGRLRAIGPYLVPVCLLLVLASVAGTDVLAAAIEHETGAAWIRSLLGVLSPEALLLAAALAPWLLMGVPAVMLATLLANAYQQRHFSELLYLAGGYWLIALSWQALTSSHAVGAWSTTVLLVWFWFPVGLAALSGWLKPRSPPPTLLVLRVFQRDAEMQALFAQVIDRWRYSGRTSLIAGTDLVLETLEPDELFAFLAGRFAERYIGDEAGLCARLEELDGTADADGRYRVTEFFCYEHTWQQALHALVRRADAVLMDLRGLAANNAGCFYELGVLSEAAGLRRSVLLYDGRTDRVAAESAIGEAAERFVWFDCRSLDRRSSENILALLMPDAK